MNSTESPSSTPTGATSAGSNHSPLPRILVVDDSRVIRNAAQKMLAHEFDVETAEDGEEGWEVLQTDATIRVVFTDLNMPNLNGYELLRKIRTAADTGIHSLPVIVVTAAEDSELARVRALELGATDFVTKPFARIDLVARARAHSTYQRITEQLRAQSTLDPLTGLTNKVGFLDRLQQDIAYARRHGCALSLVCMEIDNFRTIFLKHGKNAAESLLVQVSRLLRASIRKEDTAGRISLGGFALSLPAGEHGGIERMTNRFRAELAGQFYLPVTLSTAILSIQVDVGPSAEDAVAQCQAKLDAARVSGAPVVATATPAPIPTQSLPIKTTGPPVDVTPPHGARSLRLDPILDQIEQGHSQAAVASMPLILKRLIPLLRLLSSTQRAQLIRFLQQLPTL